MKHKLEKWSTWLRMEKQGLLAQAQNVLFFRHMFKEIQAITLANPKLSNVKFSYVNMYIWMSYLSYAVMAVRRICKPNKDSISLIGLLQDMVQNADHLTREGYAEVVQDIYGGRKLYPLERKMVDRDFDLLAGPGAVQVSVASIQADLDSLTRASETIIDYSDRRLAHIDKRSVEKVPTDADLAACLDEIERIILHYQILLKSVAMESLMPEDIPDDWKDMFRMPWIVESDSTS